GSLNLRPFYEDISDIVDQIPLGGGGQAPGNLASAERYGVDGDLTLLSEPLGWRGTRLDVGFSFLGSSVRDPLLGTPRELSGNDIVDISTDIRHDFAGGVWALGGSANWEDNAPVVRLDEVALRTESFGFVSAFIENKDVGGLTLRANMANLIDRKNRFERTVFADRSAGLIAFSEARERRFGMIFTFEVEGSF
ncbi:MAG: TonB-dependent receptor, partial [Parvibaculum sp.]